VKLQIINEKIIILKLSLHTEEVIFHMTSLQLRNDILLHIVAMYITYDIESTKPKCEKEIEKVNG